MNQGAKIEVPFESLLNFLMKRFVPQELFCQGRAREFVVEVAVRIFADGALQHQVVS